jgi:hypothetical protein
MKKIKFARRLIIFTWIFFLIYNIYFGWNLHSQSNAESTCDLIFHWSIRIGVIIYILPVFKIYEKMVKSLVD